MSDLISVIIPVYNTTEALEACVRSVLQQQYRHFEIILVDDGSTDGSASICDTLAQHHDCISVVHLKHAGSSAARNAGLRIAKGRYIAFADSDDEVDASYLSTLYDIMKSESADLACVSYQIVAKGSTPEPIDGNAEVMNFGPKDAVSHLLYQNKLDSSQCCKLYRKEVIDGIWFDESVEVYEDLLFVYLVMCRCLKVSWSNRKLYFYHKGSDGLMDSTSVQNTDAFVVMDKIRQHIRHSQWGAEMMGAIDNRTISVSFNILKLIASSQRKGGSVNTGVETLCWQNILNLRSGNFFDPHVRLKNKFGVIVSLFGKCFTKACFSRIY